jgi:hypothetical protein
MGTGSSASLAPRSIRSGSAPGVAAGALIVFALSGAILQRMPIDRLSANSLPRKVVAATAISCGSGARMAWSRIIVAILQHAGVIRYGDKGESEQAPAQDNRPR